MIETIKNIVFKKLEKYQLSDANDELSDVINGSYSIQHACVNRSLKINGEAILGKEVSIQEKIVINGTLAATCVDFIAELTASGRSSIIDSIVNDVAFFKGVLQAVNSVFVRTLHLQVSQSDFNNCKIHSLKVEALPVKKIVQKIYLNKETIVSGDIVFQSGIGEVYLDENSTILGNVQGGIVVSVK